MVDAVEADKFLEQFSATRVAGDLDALMRLFHDDAVFKIIGFGEPVEGRTAIQATVQSLVGEFEFLEWRKIHSVAIGDDIAARHHLKVKHRSTGKIAETETADFFVLKDGKCRSFHQYADTALVFELTRS